MRPGAVRFILLRCSARGHRAARYKSSLVPRCGLSAPIWPMLLKKCCDFKQEKSYSRSYRLYFSKFFTKGTLRPPLQNGYYANPVFRLIIILAGQKLFINPIK
jgi:hypothetical protein